MNHHEFWLSASLACNFLLVLLSTGSCLFLIRRVDQIVRARDTAEQRLIQLAFELRRLEQRVALLDPRRRGRAHRGGVGDLALARTRALLDRSAQPLVSRRDRGRG